MPVTDTSTTYHSGSIHSSVEGTMKKRPMLYFIREIRDNRLNEIE